MQGKKMRRVKKIKQEGRKEGRKQRRKTRRKVEKKGEKKENYRANQETIMREQIKICRESEHL